MKTLKLITLFLFAIVLMNCRKDDDDITPPETADFVKTIEVQSNTYTFNYDDQNRIQSIVNYNSFIGEDTNYNFVYNTEGLVEEITILSSFIDERHTFEYTNGILSRWEAYISGTLNASLPILHNNGNYSAVFGTYFEVNSANALTKFESLEFTLGSNSGIFTNVELQPAFYFLDDHILYDLMYFCKNEIEKSESSSLGDEGYEYTRDSDGNVIEINNTVITNPILSKTWKMTYEQRLLVK